MEELLYFLLLLMIFMEVDNLLCKQYPDKYIVSNISSSMKDMKQF